jgi:hypothetical protein
MAVNLRCQGAEYVKKLSMETVAWNGSYLFHRRDVLLEYEGQCRVFRQTSVQCVGVMAGKGFTLLLC